MITGPGAVEVRDAPDPAPSGPDGAVVGVESTAICGSDLHFYHGDLPAQAYAAAAARSSECVEVILKPEIAAT